MTTCPKCGFRSELNTPECPKCGVIYAKAEPERVKETAIRQKEAAINRKIEKEMGGFGADDGFSLWDQEAGNDREAYPLIGFLSTFFAFAAALFGIGYVAGAIYFWDILMQLGFFSQGDKLVLIGAIALADGVSVGTLLAISGALTLGRDIANNTRASREYLFRLVTEKSK